MLVIFAVSALFNFALGQLLQDPLLALLQPAGNPNNLVAIQGPIYVEASALHGALVGGYQAPVQIVADPIHIPAPVAAVPTPIIPVKANPYSPYAPAFTQAQKRVLQDELNDEAVTQNNRAVQVEKRKQLEDQILLRALFRDSRDVQNDQLVRNQLQNDQLLNRGQNLNDQALLRAQIQSLNDQSLARAPFQNGLNQYPGNQIQNGLNQRPGHQALKGLNQYPGNQVQNGLNQYSGNQVQNGLNQYPGNQIQNGLNQYPGNQVQNGLNQYPGHQIQNGLNQYPGNQVQNGLNQYPGNQLQNGLNQYPGHQIQNDQYGRRFLDLDLDFGAGSGVLFDESSAQNDKTTLADESEKNDSPKRANEQSAEADALEDEPTLNDEIKTRRSGLAALEDQMRSKKGYQTDYKK